MLRITWLKPSGGVYWAVGRSLTWDELDGWRLENLRADSYGRQSNETLYTPADWRVIQVMEAPEETRCPHYENVTQKRSPDHLSAGGNCVTKGRS